MKNRRNFYRILCVQPDAPAAVIKSSYAALMLKLKGHPDLGGDHETAALINEAYATLSNPERRAEYDRLLRARQSKAAVGGGSVHRAAKGPPDQDRPAGAVARQAEHAASSGCPFCGAPQRGSPPAAARCAQCESPLSAPMPASSDTDARGLPRLERADEVTIVVRGGAQQTRALVHDLSPAGMCLNAPEPLAVGQIIRIDSPILRAVARVVSCRREGPSPGHLVGVAFLTVEFATTRGTFVSREA